MSCISGSGSIPGASGTGNAPYCRPAFVRNSDGSYTVGAPSGEAFILPDVDITNSAGAVIDTVPSVQDYEAPDATIRNSEATQIITAPSGGIGTLPDIEIVNTFGDTETWPSAKNFTCDQVVRTYAYPQRTGATTSYRTGDDAYVQANIFNNLTVGKTPRLADFYNLKNEAGNGNTFGHFKRFTGSTGGYYDESTSQYKTLAGVVTAESLAFPSGYIIDHFTGLGWLNTNTSVAQIGNGIPWNSLIDNAWNLTYLTFTDWFIPNMSQLNSICNYGNFISGTLRMLNYAPFGVSNGQVAVSTTVNTGTSVMFLDGGRYFTLVATSTNFSPPPICRKHF